MVVFFLEAIAFCIRFDSSYRGLGGRRFFEKRTDKFQLKSHFSLASKNKLVQPACLADPISVKGFGQYQKD